MISHGDDFDTLLDTLLIDAGSPDAEKQHRLAARQHLWKQGIFSVSWLGQRRGCPSTGRNSEQASRGRRRHNEAVVAPTCPNDTGNVAQWDHQTTVHRSLIQRAAREESHPLPVGREESVALG